MRPSGRGGRPASSRCAYGGPYRARPVGDPKRRGTRPRSVHGNARGRGGSRRRFEAPWAFRRSSRPSSRPVRPSRRRSARSSRRSRRRRRGDRLRAARPPRRAASARRPDRRPAGPWRRGRRRGAGPTGGRSGGASRRRGRPGSSGARGPSPRRTIGRRRCGASSCAAECCAPCVPVPCERLYRRRRRLPIPLAEARRSPHDAGRPSTSRPCRTRSAPGSRRDRLRHRPQGRRRASPSSEAISPSASREASARAGRPAARTALTGWAAPRPAEEPEPRGRG